MEEKKGPRQARREKELEKEQRQKAGGKKKWAVAGILIAAAAAAVFGYIHMQNEKVHDLLRAEGIYENITIDGESVAGMTEAGAMAILEEKYDLHISDQVLTLYHGEEKWQIPFAEIGAGYDVEGAVQEAYRLGREGTEKERFAIGRELLQNGADIEVAYTYDAALLQEKLEAIAQEFDREAENSTITHQNGKFEIGAEKTGRKMNREKTTELVAAIVETQKGGKAEIAAEVTEPEVTAEDNAHVTDLIGTYYTTYSNSDKNRNNNLVVGCNYINGTILAPGEVFSANVGLGSQTAAGGYRNAGVYSNGKVELGMAGGVCQVTSTIYNAVIMAELEVVERHPHSMTVGYVPLGRDAAVAGTYKDLKFKNNTEYPVLIEAYASGGKLVVNLYGHEIHNAGRTLEYETVYEATIPKPAEIVTEDPERPEGEREVTSNGRTGCKVSVYKKVFENGKQVSKDWFSSSSYRAVADEVTVGTKKAEPEATDVMGMPSFEMPSYTIEQPAEQPSDGYGIQ